MRDLERQARFYFTPCRNKESQRDSLQAQLPLLSTDYGLGAGSTK